MNWKNTIITAAVTAVVIVVVQKFVLPRIPGFGSGQ